MMTLYSFESPEPDPLGVAWRLVRHAAMWYAEEAGFEGEREMDKALDLVGAVIVAAIAENMEAPAAEEDEDIQDALILAAAIAERVAAFRTAFAEKEEADHER